jgi:hypothetical protein
VVADGSGGAYVAWQDSRSGAGFDVYAQRLTSAGAPVWAVNGVPVCVAANAQSGVVITSDGTGSAVIAWSDQRASASNDIYAQRLNGSGVAQWTTDGIVVCNAANIQDVPAIVSDGSNGGIITWEDARSGLFDIYAQRVNSSGTALWTPNGAALCVASGIQQKPALIGDGASGAIVAWEDYRDGSTDNVYAQRVNSAGAVQWQTDGVMISGTPGKQNYVRLVTDGAKGAIIAWSSQPSGIIGDVYAQHVTTNGNLTWHYGGVAISTATNDQVDETLVADGAGGAIIAYDDYRDGISYHIYAQHVNAAGIVQWTANGVLLSGTTSDRAQVYTTTVPDGSGNALVAWVDTHAGELDIYAQRVTGTYGYWGHPEPTVTAVKDIAHDQGGKVAVNWTASGRDLPTPTIDFYSVWRATDISPSGPSGSSINTTPLDRITRDTPHGTLAQFPTSSYYWELVGTQTAYRFPSYSFAADTRADSIAGATGTEQFMVSAHAYDQHIAFQSNVLSGHSVDNLAPPAPLSLTAQRIGDWVYLKWNGVHVPDLGKYSVYRKTSTGVTPVPANFLADDHDTLLTDTTAPTSALYYIVTAIDVHKNQGTKSNEASVAASTGVGNLPPITALTVLQNHPNPFTGETQLQVGLPAREDVRIQIYDVAGKRVRDVTIPNETKGWDTVKLTARDDHGSPLASGVYFYRVHAGSETVTKKMVIAR